MRKLRLKIFENVWKVVRNVWKYSKSSAKRLKIFENIRIFCRCLRKWSRGEFRISWSVSRSWEFCLDGTCAFGRARPLRKWLNLLRSSAAGAIYELTLAFWWAIYYSESADISVLITYSFRNAVQATFDYPKRKNPMGERCKDGSGGGNDTGQTTNL